MLIQGFGKGKTKIQQLLASLPNNSHKNAIQQKRLLEDFLSQKFFKSISLFYLLAIVVETDLLQKLGSKEISKAQLFQLVETDFGLLPKLFEGTLSSKSSVRYGCASV